MKTRNGFVSNSSSSSFLIYGVYDPDVDIDVSTFVDLEILKPKWETWHKDRLEKYDWHKDETFEEFLEGVMEDGIGEALYILDSILGEGFNFEHHSPFGDYHYFGVDPRKMDDNETMGEFKERITKMCKDIFGDDVEAGWHEYAWRDG